MPTRARKRKASEEEGDEVEEVSQPAKKSVHAAQRKPRISEPQSSKSGGSSKRGRASLSNLTTGNTSKTSKSTSSSARSAKGEIRRNADDLINLIEGRCNNAQAGIAVGNSLRAKITTTLQDGIDTRNIVYQKSHDRIKTLQDTIHGYEAANRSSINIRKPAEVDQWEQDAKDVSKVNKKAMEILIQTLHGLVISGEHASLLRSPLHSNDDVEQAAWRWVEGGIPPAQDSWGSSARETLRAFAEISRLLL